MAIEHCTDMRRVPGECRCRHLQQPLWLPSIALKRLMFGSRIEEAVFRQAVICGGFQKPLAMIVISEAGPYLCFAVEGSQLRSGFPDPDRIDLLPMESQASCSPSPCAECRMRTIFAIFPNPSDTAFFCGLTKMLPAWATGAMKGPGQAIPAGAPCGALGPPQDCIISAGFCRPPNQRLISMKKTGTKMIASLVPVMVPNSIA